MSNLSEFQSVFCASKSSLELLLRKPGESSSGGSCTPLCTSYFRIPSLSCWVRSGAFALLLRFSLLDDFLGDVFSSRAHFTFLSELIKRGIEEELFPVSFITMTLSWWSKLFPDAKPEVFSMFSPFICSGPFSKHLVSNPPQSPIGSLGSSKTIFCSILDPRECPLFVSNITDESLSSSKLFAPSNCFKLFASLSEQESLFHPKVSTSPP
mmetsp:Transcript_19302/g.35002  ORF Transcript_19302/g.35002 Transcript_19302/m.35002 type:complete len:210 (-) Transcript_19302:1869-2498(-)